jgi:hypothetical protein
MALTFFIIAFDVLLGYYCQCGASFKADSESCNIIMIFSNVEMELQHILYNQEHPYVIGKRLNHMGIRFD